MKQKVDGVELDEDQLLGDLEGLGEISGKGTSAGVDRVAFSEADCEARSWVDARMRNVGMEVRTDAAYNSIGVYQGTALELAPIALGSHTDSVPNGGRYDGTLGVVAGLACVRALGEVGARLRHPVEVINFSAEEATIGGGTFGSKAMAGLLEPADVNRAALDGRTVADHLLCVGIEPSSVTGAARPQGALAAYLELHAEQGGTLDSACLSVGTVEGIVGIRRYEATFEGLANHAGTTPMEGRRDALVASASFILAVREVAEARKIVGTVGQSTVSPGSPSVIPARVELSLEIRGLQDKELDGAEEELRGLAGESSAKFERVSYKPPAISDARVLTALESACEELGIPYKRMVSGAGHDAMCMAAITRQAMLFVPSQDGISHSPKEYTDPESFVVGARVLLAALLALDADLDREES